MYAPISREEHLKRGYCCQSGCRYCPWDYAKRGNPPITPEERARYRLEEHPKETR